MPFLVSDVHGLSGLALANAEPEEAVNTSWSHIRAEVRTAILRFMVLCECLMI